MYTTVVPTSAVRLDACTSCRVVLAEGLSLRKQVQLVSQSHIVIMNHGAAMGNIMFMAPVRLVTEKREKQKRKGLRQYRCLKGV